MAARDGMVFPMTRIGTGWIVVSALFLGCGHADAPAGPPTVTAGMRTSEALTGGGAGPQSPLATPSRGQATAVASVTENAQGEAPLAVDLGQLGHDHPNSVIEVAGTTLCSRPSGASSGSAAPCDPATFARALSPDRQRLVYVKRGGTAEAPTMGLWIGDVGRSTPELLVPGETPNEQRAREEKSDYEHSRAGLGSAQFALDGKSVFFDAQAWRSERALQVVDLTTHKVSFVAAATAFEVLPSGKFRGALLTSRWRRAGGMSNDWCAVVGANGKDRAPVGWFEDGVPWKSAYCTLADPRVVKLLGP
jgi:hypothetical protein